MKLKLMITGIALIGFFTAQADTILWDINFDANPANQATNSDFTALGVSEDLTGATVSQVIASTNSTMSDGTVSLSYLTGIAYNAFGDTSPNAVLSDYLYLQDGAEGGPVTMQISGLSGVLAANTTYSLYLFGAGNNTDQGASFTFDSITKDTTSAATAPEATAKFNFTTDAVVSDTLNFDWARTGSNTYSGFNGFAIVAVPEPATIGLIGVFGAILMIHRRHTLRKQQA